MNDAPIIVRDLPAGTKVRTDSGIWTAGDPKDITRWMHEAGERCAADRLIQEWVTSGKARPVQP